MPSIKANFSLKDEDVERVRKAIKRVGYTSEEVINNYLHNVAGEKISKSITRFIPVSKRKKVHAKDSKWSEQKNHNMAVTISNKTTGKKSFYYLYYVATGTGTSKRNGKNDFMKKGMDKEYNNIVNGLIEELSTNIEKEMNK